MRNRVLVAGSRVGPVASRSSRPWLTPGTRVWTSAACSGLDSPAQHSDLRPYLWRSCGMAPLHALPFGVCRYARASVGPVRSPHVEVPQARFRRSLQPPGTHRPYPLSGSPPSPTRPAASCTSSRSIPVGESGFCSHRTGRDAEPTTVALARSPARRSVVRRRLCGRTFRLATG